MTAKRWTILGAAVAMALGGVAAPAAAQKGMISVNGKGPAKGMQQLIIGQFTVGFVNDRTDAALAKGFNVAGLGGATSRVRQILAGVSDQEMQQITDAAYADFVAKLTAAGYQVLDRAPLVAHPGVAKVQPATAPYAGGFKREKGNSAKLAYFGATATQPYRLTSESTDSGILGGFKGIGDFMAYGMGVSTYVRDNKAYVVDVLYALDFADAKKSGGFGATTSSVKATAGLAMVEEQTRVTVHGPSMSTSTLTLAKPVELPADFFTQDDVTSRGVKRGEAVGNALAMLTGGGTSKTKEVSFTAAPGRYAPAALQAAQQTNDLMVAQLVALR